MSIFFSNVKPLNELKVTDPDGTTKNINQDGEEDPNNTSTDPTADTDNDANGTEENQPEANPTDRAGDTTTNAEEPAGDNTSELNNNDYTLNAEEDPTAATDANTPTGETNPADDTDADTGEADNPGNGEEDPTAATDDATNNPEDPTADTDNPDDTGDGTGDVGGEEQPEDGGDTGTEEPTGDGTTSELQDSENQIFANLTPEQLEIKNKELKARYTELYKSLTGIVDRVNSIPKQDSNIKELGFISDKLSDLQEIIPYYLNNTFDTKTYIENSINYQQYLVVIGTINKLLIEITPEDDKSDTSKS